jgi:hypothetical protein
MIVPMDTDVAEAEPLLQSLDRIRRTPLGELKPADCGGLLRTVLAAAGDDQVSVARFGSAI